MGVTPLLGFMTQWRPMVNEQLQSGPNGKAEHTPAPPTLPPPVTPYASPVPVSPPDTPTLHAPRPTPLPRRRRPRGRVARLPLQVRNLVNHALRDGAPYADILGLLAAHGFNNFHCRDIVSWAKLGYRDWLAEQQRFEQSRPRSQRAAAVLGSLREDGRSDSADLNESMLSSLFNDLLESFDEAALKELFAAKPEDFLRFAKTIAAFTIARSQREQVQLQRLKYELEIRKIQERHARRLKPQEITPEIQARIDAAAKLL